MVAIESCKSKMDGQDLIVQHDRYSNGKGNQAPSGEEDGCHMAIQQVSHDNPRLPNVALQSFDSNDIV